LISKSFWARSRSIAATRFWLIMSIGAVYAAWSERNRFIRMNGYGSQCRTHATTFSVAHIRSSADWTPMNHHESTIAATRSAAHSPQVRRWATSSFTLRTGGWSCSYGSGNCG
jgi:hypothetical protein